MLGAAAIAVAIVIPTIDGGELSEAWWSAMAGLFLVGTALFITGVVKLASGSGHREDA